MCVLLVEDDALIREVMSETLQDAGYEVQEAEDGLAALKLLESPPRTFRIVFTDFHMPGGVDGAQVAERARAVWPDVAVIIASGRPEVLQPKWRETLGYRLLKKPYLPSEMLRLVAALAVAPEHGP